jgi:preprotein translocase subunit SecG
MYLFTVVLHVFLSLFLIVVILLQPGKGGDVGNAFGGGLGSGAMFGPRGAGNLLSRATTVVAVLFMTTSITLALFSNKRMMEDSDVADELERLEAEEQVVPEGVDGSAPVE